MISLVGTRVKLDEDLVLMYEGEKIIDHLATNNHIQISTTDVKIGHIKSPIVWDANGNHAEAIYTIDYLDDDEYLLTLMVPFSWFYSPETVFPVYADPTITTNDNGNAVWDTFLAGNCPDDNYGRNDYLHFGYNDGYTACPYNDGHRVSILSFNSPSSETNFDIPSSVESNDIVYARLFLYIDSSESQGTSPSMRPVRLMSSWDEYTTTYWTFPSHQYDSNEVYAADNTFDHFASWTITDTVNETLNGSTCYGIGLIPVNYSTTEDNWTSVHSYENPSGNTPYVEVSISCRHEIDDTSQSFPEAGGTHSIDVTSNLDSCSWTSSESASWIRFTSSSSGSGDGTVSYRVDPNANTSSRTATITIAGNSHTVTQEGAAVPTIYRSPSSLSQTATEGTNAASQSFSVRNSGDGTLSYSVSDNASWLSCTPTSGTSTGEMDTITVNYSTSGLSAGTEG